MLIDHGEKVCEILTEVLCGNDPSGGADQALRQVRALLLDPHRRAALRWDEIIEPDGSPRPKLIKRLWAVERHRFLGATAEELFRPLEVALRAAAPDGPPLSPTAVRAAAGAWLTHLEEHVLCVGGDWLHRSIPLCPAEFLPGVCDVEGGIGETDLDEDWWLGDADPFHYSLRTITASSTPADPNARSHLRRHLCARIEGTCVTVGAFEAAAAEYLPYIKACSDLVLGGLRPNSDGDASFAGPPLDGAFQEYNDPGVEHNESDDYIAMLRLLHGLRCPPSAGDPPLPAGARPRFLWAITPALAARVRRAATLHAMSSASHGLGRLVLASAALEALLGDKQGPVEDSLEDRVCALLVDPPERTAVRKWFSALYGRRCAVVHGRASDLGEAAERTTKTIAATTGAALIALCHCAEAIYRLEGEPLSPEDLFRRCAECMDAGMRFPWTPESLVDRFQRFARPE